MQSPSPFPIRIVFIDDQAIERTALRMFLDSWPKTCVVGEAGNQREALAVAAREQPDVILLNLDPGDTSGLDLLPELFTTAPAARVLILTGASDPAAHRRAVGLGVMGVVLKGQRINILLQAIEKVHAGEVWLEPCYKGGKQTDSEEVRIATLTTREREVSMLVGEGWRNKQIAQRLLISQTTVRYDLTSIFRKLGVAGRLKLIIYAYRHGLAKMPP